MPFLFFYLALLLCIISNFSLATDTKDNVIDEEYGTNVFTTSRQALTSHHCPRDSCGKFRSRMHKIQPHNDKCRDGCKLTVFLPKLRGWECGSCEEWRNSYAGFDATFVYRNVNDPVILEIFAQAKARWETVIVGDLPSRRIPFIRKGPYQSECRLGTMPRIVDDVLVCAAINEIDGRGGILAQANASYRRWHSGLTIYGSMTVDTADLEWVTKNGSLKGILMHEMGHVYGLNAFSWKKKGLINSRKPTCNYRVQSAASRAWQNVTGCGPEYAVPIENDGSQGTACSHFDEGCLRSELMTGYISNAILPLSIVTVGALEDLGYVVDYTTADNYTGFSCTSQCEPPTRRVRRRSLIEEDSGYQLAVQYGKEFLQNQTLGSNESVRLMESEEGIEFIGDQYVSIVYLDDVGTVRHVEVTVEDLA